MVENRSEGYSVYECWFQFYDGSLSKVSESTTKELIENSIIYFTTMLVLENKKLATQTSIQNATLERTIPNWEDLSLDQQWRNTSECLKLGCDMIRYQQKSDNAWLYFNLPQI